MIVIRLFRTGKKNQPSFKIVVTDKKNPSRSGRFLESVGSYTPITKERKLKGDRIKYWLSVGAKPSPTVYNLLVSEKIIEGKKIDVHKKSKKATEAVMPAAEAAPAAAPAEKEKPAEEKPVEPLKEAAPASAEAASFALRRQSYGASATEVATKAESAGKEPPKEAKTE